MTKMKIESIYDLPGPSTQYFSLNAMIVPLGNESLVWLGAWMFFTGLTNQDSEMIEAAWNWNAIK